MNTYYFNNSARVYKDELTVVTEATFRKIQDNLLCETPNGSWNDHWLHLEAKTLTDAKAKIRKEWF